MFCLPDCNVRKEVNGVLLNADIYLNVEGVHFIVLVEANKNKLLLIRLSY